MQVLVTGGCGFIGSHLVDALLKDGHCVRILDNLSTGRICNLEHVEEKVKIIQGDLNDPHSLNLALQDIDWVFHLAALADIVPSIQDPEKYFQSNVIGTIKLLEMCRKKNIKRIIYAASSSSYGIPNTYPTPETSPIDTKYPYALTKRMGEELVMHWSEVYKIPALSLRLFNVYGTRSRTSGTYGAVFGVFLAQKLANKPFTVVGDGEQTRDFTYVTDVAQAFLAAAKSTKTGEVYNVGSGKTISINRIVELLSGEKIYLPKRPGEPNSTFADISKILNELSWKPKISIEEGVEKILEDINYWKEAPVWDQESISEATKDWFKYLSPIESSK